MIATILYLAAVAAVEPSPAAPKLERAIPLPGVRGRIDHLAADAKGKRLFVACLGNGTVEVIDLGAGRVVRTIKGLKEPQGIAYLPAPDRIAVACGDDGTCRLYDARSFQLEKSIELGEDADNVRAEPEGKRIFVGHGKGAISAIDISSMAVIASVKLDGHPESFQLETKGARIFVNVPAAREIEVIDRGKMEVIARWHIEGAEANFPMAIDEPAHHLLVVCRKPARLLVLDTETGKQVSAAECSGDADDIFMDVARKRAYVSCGEGFIDVFEESGGTWQRVVKEKTKPGARTSLFPGAFDRLFLAAPARDSREAEILIYQPD